MRMPGVLLLASVLFVTGLAEPKSVMAVEPSVVHAVPTAGPVTVLSYNVEGLPWPLTHGRTAAAATIAAELRAMHDRGDGPQVVAMQEAFGAAQKAIGSAAGYRYVAYGPSATDDRAAPTTADQRAFVADASLWHGETEGAREDSGLAVFSDYPILWVKRVAFPAYACAGFDCLANKGMLAVALRVPGQSAPLVVVDTHLNSRAASGVKDARSFYAYQRQADALRSFIAGVGAGGASVMLAGDFNVGNDPQRQAYLGAALGGDGMTIAASETACGATCRAIAPTPTLAHAKTLVAYHGTLTTAGATRSFGTLPDGDRLSDHIGVIRQFAFNL
ncbi:endonuclease/exonuclease/phosphatase family protein [Sphingomonas sp. CV7422]|uniref:endonuclease/exonuclease/phosphatase family protein n=1 Tax=Sphingomonas sp. CV7422 TaxID=3018036 RepID=UPI0022FDE42C|nr:endonuclease/exonuclease/phosphatase family protein [Sphingomonas sp. CV7422]